jgi:large subunit ribosomal protein L9
MKVILNQDIPNIGEEGEIKDVARGYARNYLIPNRMVMPYTREALSMLESRREAIEQRREEKRNAAMDIKTRLESEPLEIEMPAGERGRLFGSVTSATIADALASKGIDVERKRIDVPDKTIKNLGTTYVRVRLYGEQEAELRVDVTAAGGAKAEAAKTEAAKAEAAKAEAGEAPAQTSSEEGAPAAEAAEQTEAVPATPRASEEELTALQQEAEEGSAETNEEEE